MWHVCSGLGVIAIGPIAGLLAAVLMVTTIRLPSAIIAGAAFFLIGVGPILWVISTTTLRQAVTPRDLLGRVSAINIMATGARPVGAAAGAVIGALSGAEACLVAAAIGFLISGHRNSGISRHATRGAARLTGECPAPGLPDTCHIGDTSIANKKDQKLENDLQLFVSLKLYSGCTHRNNFSNFRDFINQ